MPEAQVEGACLSLCVGTEAGMEAGMSLDSKRERRNRYRLHQDKAFARQSVIKRTPTHPEGWRVWKVPGWGGCVQEGKVSGASSVSQAGCWFREAAATEKQLSVHSRDTFTRRLRSDASLPFFMTTHCAGAMAVSCVS